MGVMLRLDNRGHGELAKWNQEDRRATEVAEKVFAEHQAKHYTMFDISSRKASDAAGGSKTGDNDEPGELMKTFDPAVEEILAVPRMKAG